ncbi:ficolin-2 isoform X2 [Culex quinquefasciatus]|uniref:ficolin-2 isoform X2 n=1 Tax=Culex quinquefasciatus TaxID=7176 RepID=UPI0018E2DC2E|nr:ficolin-2 isoform X2 [Culex quinquefasciatus]
MIQYWLIFILKIGLLVADAAPSNDSNGLGYELLLTKMDYLEYKFLELQVEIKEQIESVLLKQEKSERAVLEQTSDILVQQKVFADHEALKKSIFDLRPRKHPSDNSEFIEFLYKKHVVTTPAILSIKSCESGTFKKSGKYLLSLADATEFEVYCEQDMHDGGWIVIQNRFDGSVDFYRNWTEYKNGFGSLDGEFWLGLDKIHKLTSFKTMELLIYVEDFNGHEKYAIYSDFSIGTEREHYTLNVISGERGNLNDSLLEQNGKKFSTFDVDNDEDSSLSCASERRGAWWYDYCSHSNLNGPHTNEEKRASMYWYAFSNKYQGLKISKMMIRCTE